MRAASLALVSLGAGPGNSSGSHGGSSSAFRFFFLFLQYFCRVHRMGMLDASKLVKLYQFLFSPSKVAGA